MKKFVSLLIVLLLLVPSAALADTTITAKGSATVQAEPDMAIVLLGVEESQRDVAAAQRMVNEKTASIIEALTNAGVAQEDIRTEYYNIYTDYRTSYDTESETRYVASCTLRVVARDVDKAGELIDIAFAAGANQISNISFGVSDVTAMQDKALELAVADGMRRAGIIAKASGVILPACPDAIEETATYYDGSAQAYAMDTAAEAAGTQLMGGTVSVSASVVVSYEVED